jgi:hypothetical protein
MEKQTQQESGETVVVPAPSGRLQLVWRVLTRRDGRAPVWLEALVVVWLLWLYDEINDLAPLRRIAALHNAVGILNFERSLNLAPELGLDRWLAAHATLGLILSYYYVSAHFFVTFGLLAFLWWRKPRTYRPLRTQLVIINLIGLAIFWLYPVAPPRMLASDGFRDVIALTQAVGDFHTGALAKTADQYAAMPSLHIAWAIWSAKAVWSIFRNRLARVVALIYPAVTAFVVIATGNHFLLDVLAGAMVAGAAFLLEWAAARWIPWYSRRRHGLAELRRGPAPQPGGAQSGAAPAGS